MSTPATLLNDGVAALKQGDYAAAIAPLKAFCESPIAPDSKVYLQAHKFLVQAYIKEQQRELALETCMKLAQSKVPQVQQWANEAIPVLETHLPQSVDKPVDQNEAEFPEDASGVSDAAASDAVVSDAVEDSVSPITIDPAEAKSQINDGIQAFRLRDYAQAIVLLEPLRDGLPSHADDYSRVQMTLAKAYQAEGQIEAARGIAEAMLESDRDDLSIWGSHFLNHLKPTPESELATQSATTQPATQPESQPEAQPESESSVSEDSDSPPPSPQLPNTSVSGIAYEPPTALSPIPSQYPDVIQDKGQVEPQQVVRRDPTVQRDPNDHTAVIQSALSHGSVSFLFSLLLYQFFPFPLAILCDLLRWAIPFGIYYTATDPIAKENAKQASNYAITAFAISMSTILGSVVLIASLVGMAVFFPLLIVLAVPLAIYGLLLMFWPVAATFICIANPENTFHYPRWLVWRLLK